MPYTRRDFLTTAASAIGGSLLPLGSALAATPPAPARPARWRRFDVATDQGQKMLASYARGIQAMLKLPPEHPHNWFRHAFIHFMDCPHGNWWFYVWHRGYIGYFEQAIRKLSGDPDFALPYWDWTRQPEMPLAMFDGVLTPTDSAYAPYTGNLQKFTRFVQPSLARYWNSLDPDQRQQLATRGYKTFEDAWYDVTGFSLAQKTGLSGNQAFAITCGARYLSRDNRHLDAKTRYDVSAVVVRHGLTPTAYYDPDITRSFTSSRTASHLMQGDGATQLSILEGFPHNKVHNYIGGMGPIDPGPYGNMTNFLSPVDPIFFLHHANMDRLWDVWTRKQIERGLPILPTGPALTAFTSEPFLFYVDGDGRPVGPSTAGRYLSTAAFDYDYGPGGFDGAPIPWPMPPAAGVGPASQAPLQGRIDNGTASVAVPAELVRRHLAGQLAVPLTAEITLDRPHGLAVAREFDVLVNAPDDLQRVEADSPYYAGTLAFFGPTMPNMAMSHSASFAVPLPPTLRALSQAEAGTVPLRIRLVPSGSHPAEPVPVRALRIGHGG